MNIRFTLLASGLTLCVGSFAQTTPQAQPATTPPQELAPVPAQTPQSQPVDMSWQGLAEELALTPDQLTALEKIDNEHREAMKALNRENLEQAAKRERVTAMRDKKQAAIKGVLTAEQMAKLQAKKQAQRDAGLQKSQQRTAAPQHQE